jgi:drug/metabolite transporter (DMT)-like permease
VARIPVGLALLSFNTYPLWTAAAVWAIYGHKPERAVMIAMPVILFGLALALDVSGMASGLGLQAHWLRIGSGVGFALDQTLNTASHVSAAVNALAGVTAAASGTGADPITAAEGPHTFAGGLDGTVAEAYAYQQDANFFYVPIAQNTVAGKNWRRADLTVVY